jgi:regulator of protease activity HflC (stomatin/prohibitin superfamily)
MFGLIGFYKGEPTDYIIRYQRGRVMQEGPGIAFTYWKPTTSVVSVPTGSVDVNFIFNEMTANFQSVALQGQFAYRISDPRRATALFRFTVNPRTKSYHSDDPDKLKQRITNVIQMETRRDVLARSLEATLRESEAIATSVLARVREQTLLVEMGVELLSLFFQAVKPTPEVAKALEAEYREQLLRAADEAIYARRAAAVGEERKIQENELQNQIALEQQRLELLQLSGENAEREAEYRGRALEKEAEFKGRAIAQELAGYRTLEPRALLALGLRELGQNAEKVGNLTITSEILAALLNGTSPVASNGE